jgi:hypothetical protein
MLTKIPYLILTGKSKYAILSLALLCRLERVPTFLVPIINPPFADTAGNYMCPKIVEKGVRFLKNGLVKITEIY